MRFAPLSVELIRARPALVFWLVTLAYALFWFILPLLLYSNAPGQLATTLAFGREYALAPPSGPPLAFWLADIAFRMAGNRLFGVYLLSQVCLIVAFWAVFALGRAIAGAPQSVLAVLLTIAITAFSFPALEFGPDFLALPLWGLTLLFAWRAIGQGHRRAWIGLALCAGLLLMTSYAALLLIGLLVAFMIATAQGRRLLATADPWFALLLVAVLVFPYALVVLRTSVNWPAVAAGFTDHQAALQQSYRLIAGVLLALPGVVLVAVANSRWIGRDEDAPFVERRPLNPLARPFILTFAIAPVILTGGAAMAAQSPVLIGGTGLSLLMTGLAIVVGAGDLIRLRRHAQVRRLWLIAMAAPAVFVLAMSLIQPWVLGREVQTMLPARRIAGFFADNFQRRTGQPLRAVTGDADLATAVSFAARTRPHLYLADSPAATPWMTPQKFLETGGVAVWRATDTAGTVPDDLARRFPGLVPEVPVTFQHYMQGRQPVLRIGWAVIRPAAPATRQ